MKDILEICQEVADMAAVGRPKDLFSGKSEHENIFKSIATETLDELLEYGDWRDSIRQGRLLTNCHQKDYNIRDFCDDFYCLMNETIYIVDTQDKVIGSITPEQYLKEKVFNCPSLDMKFLFQNGLIRFLSAPGDYKIVFMYRSNAIVYDPTSGYMEKSAFTKNTDIPIFDYRLVKKGIYWRWLRRNGMDYQEEFNTYERALSRTFGSERASQDINLAGNIFDGNDLGGVYVNAATECQSCE